MEAELRKFRCRVRTRGFTLAIDCLAPDERTAAHAVGNNALRDDPAPWVQVVVSEWNAALQEYLVSPNAVVVTRDDPYPPGVELVVLSAAKRSRATEP